MKRNSCFKSPKIWSPDDLKNHVIRQTRINVEGNWVPPRVYEDFSIIKNLKCALLVLLGEADTVVWKE
jgi:hypothetical protein